MLRVMLVALVVFATIYAFVDCVQTDRRRGADRCPSRSGSSRSSCPSSARSAGSWPAEPVPAAVPRHEGRVAARPGREDPEGPLGPDDDPDFLRKL